jgi:DNA-binding NarL/FixJ family response regulator
MATVGTMEEDEDYPKLATTRTEQLIKILTEVIILYESSSQVKPPEEVEPDNLAILIRELYTYCLFRCKNIGLTPRQVLITRCIGAGLKNKEIAARLGIKTSTVKTNIEHLIAKAKTESRYGIARLSAMYPKLEADSGVEDCLGDPGSPGKQLRPT